MRTSTRSVAPVAMTTAPAMSGNTEQIVIIKMRSTLLQRNMYIQYILNIKGAEKGGLGLIFNFHLAILFSTFEVEPNMHRNVPELITKYF